MVASHAIGAGSIPAERINDLREVGGSIPPISIFVGGLAQMVERSLSMLTFGVIAQRQSFRLQSGWSVVQFHVAPFIIMAHLV